MLDDRLSSPGSHPQYDRSSRRLRPVVPVVDRKLNKEDRRGGGGLSYDA